MPGYGGVIGPSGLRANVYVFDVSYLRCHSISNTLEVCKVTRIIIPSLVASDQYIMMPYYPENNLIETDAGPGS